jgi:hypothetical protein
VSATGDVLKSVDVPLSTLISAGALTTFKNSLNTGVAALATNRSINPNL